MVLFGKVYHRISLNRTSVGLKLKRAVKSGADELQPQSNQRGIETKLKEV